MNIFDVKIPETGEIFEALYEKNGVLIEQIVSSDKLESKIYKQPYDEWLVLLKGKASLHVNDEEVVLDVGDTFLIEKDVEHKVLSCEMGTLWLCVHVKGNDSV